MEEEEDPLDAYMREIEVTIIISVYQIERNQSRCCGIAKARL